MTARASSPVRCWPGSAVTTIPWARPARSRPVPVARRAAMAEGARYRFEPLERRGLVLGLSASQVASASLAVMVAFGLLLGHRGPAGIGGAGVVLGLGGLLCRPVLGRSCLSWPALCPGRAVPLPTKALALGLTLREVPGTARGQPAGVLLDERAGTVAAVLRARGGAFCLLDEADKQRKLAAWAAVLESLASHQGPLARLQWCQRSLPGDVGGLLDRLESAGDPQSPSYRSYRSLAKAAWSWQQDTFLVVVSRWQGRPGRRAQQYPEALFDYVGSLCEQLHAAGFGCEPALGAAGIASVLGSYLVPEIQRHKAAYPWPLAVEEHWGSVRVEGLWHRTYWVAEWPRSDVGPDFLSPLLLGAGRRSFSVLMAPVPPERAAREAASSRTAQLADSRLRQQGGFLETARHRREAEALEAREAQIAGGRSAFQLAGYVTVSASGPSELGKASTDLEQAAGAAKLCLRCLYGQQKEALGWALPLGRGL